MDKIKTSGMKLSEIRPCDSCNGKIAPIFYVIEVKRAFFSERNVNSVLGTNQIFGGRSLALAEAMASGADEAIIVSEEESLNDILFICQDCFLKCSLDLAVIVEKVAAEKEKKNVVAKDV